MPAPIDTPNAPDTGEPEFTVISQKVELDIDFINRSVTGSTTITVQPLVKTLKTFLLHCRQCRILSATVQKRSAAFRYKDPYSRTVLWDGRASIRQHEYLRARLDRSIGQSPAPDLTITLPPGVIVKDLDTHPSQFSAPKLGGTGPGARKDSEQVETPTFPTAVESTNAYAPVDILITFQVTSFREGIHFVGFDRHDSRYPHMYTTNRLFPGAASSIFPCLDTANARYMWEISIRFPKTLGDAFRLPRQPQDPPEREPEFAIPLSDEDKSLELVVACSGESTDDISDPDDDSRRTVTFACGTPVAARHVGFAIGPFQVLDLSAEFRQTDEDEKLGQSAVKVLTYSLPGRADEVRNTCVTMSMAVDYFTVTFGSFPFPDYQICFVDDLPSDTADAAGLSICSNRLLFKENLIDPLDSHTRTVTRALAVQYSGVNIISKDPSDLWVVTGIAGFMTDLFMKKIAGNNEYRFAQKRAADKIHEMDVDRYSVHQLGGQLDIDPSELDFLCLKSAVVLFILDRRLTKVSGGAGLSRILNKIFLNARTGSLPNNEVNTEWFMRLCEKLGHTKLDVFFRQWIYGAGCPDFRVSQQFNRKKLVVDMVFEQTQSKRTQHPRLHPKTFLREAKEQVAEAWVPAIQPVFTGPMTIRIHEADGTPYEHIVEIRDMVTRIEIPYNTKYKRLKRNKRNREKGPTNDVNADGETDSLLYCLGDTLQTELEMQQWRLVEWDAEIENMMSGESYEWIRLDADFEWIGSFQFHMKPYMYVSQLQQDRDVVAQYNSLQNIVEKDPHPMMSTILVRTLMDQRYFHGIRSMAARGLAKCAHPSVDNIGLFHLEKAFREFFCVGDSQTPKPNDFSNRALYLIQCAIPEALALVRDERGAVPRRVRQFLLEKLKFNDNSLNAFSDSFYISTLLRSLSRTVAVNAAAASDQKNDPFSIDLDDEAEKDPQDERINSETLAEIDRYRRMDEWISSYQNIFTKAAIKGLTSMVQAKIANDGRALVDLLQYTRPGNADGVRKEALEALVELKAARKPQILKYMLHALAGDPSPAMRAILLSVIGQALGSIAIGDDKPPPNPVRAATDGDSGLVLEQHVQMQVTQEDLERKTSPAVALDVLKDTVKDIEIVQQAMWHAIQSPFLSLNEIASLLDVAALLFDSSSTIGSLVWVKPMPRTYKVTPLGGGHVVFTRTDSVRWKPSKYAPLSSADFKKVQSNGLRYTGPVVEEAKPIVKPVEQIRLKLGSKPLSPSVKAPPPNVQMSAPPIPQHSTAPVKLSLKRKQSIDGAKLVSPKLAKAPKTNPSPSPLVLSRSPSGNVARATSVTPGPAAPPLKDSGLKSRMVTLKTGGLGHRIDAIMSSLPRAIKSGTVESSPSGPIAVKNAVIRPETPAKRLMLKIKGLTGNGDVLSGTAVRATVERIASSPRVQAPQSANDGLFSNIKAMQAGWNMGGFRNFGSTDGNTGLDVSAGLVSAISPRTVWPSGRPISNDSSLSVPSQADTRPSSARGPAVISRPAVSPNAVSPFTTAMSTDTGSAPARIKDESSDDEPLIQIRHGTPKSGTPQAEGLPPSAPASSAPPGSVPAPAVAQGGDERQPSPRKPGLFKLKLGKRS